ncbi:MAG: M20/M25/M40 family metallo-hydrolase [Prevotellaceae bacterium]|jgi:hypothetical protein|nr:M20/M25/M40 family metallo-hydrolase [Prevotellaceae bacterium]
MKLKNKDIYKILFSVLVSGLCTAISAQSTLTERVKKHVHILASDSLKGRKAGSRESDIAARYIVNQWKETGLAPYRNDTYYQPFTRENGTYKNIIAIVRGNDPVLQNEYIVIGAHYDHLGYKMLNDSLIVYNGADDNASGVAAITETARKIVESSSKLKRSVIFVAFDAEEIGLYGSEYFVDNPVVPLNRIKLMLSVDMVGWHAKSGYVKYAGTGTVVKGKELITDKSRVPDNLNVTIKDFETSILTATDTEPFARRNIPTLAVTTGLKSPYHSPEDDADLIDYDGLALIVEHLSNIILHVSGDENYRASKKIASKHRPLQKFHFGVSANIGSNYHHYTDGALNGKSASAFGIGLTSQFNFEHFAVRPEIFYEHIKAKYPAGKIATNNITVPLNFVLQTNGQLSADAFLGGYYSYRFNGKTGKNSIDFANEFYRHEAGLNYGAGVKLFNLKISYTYRLGLTNFTRFKNADNAHILNRASYFTITYIL